MRLFLKYLATVCAIAVVTSVSMGKLVDHGLILLENSRYQEWDNIARGSINAEVVILGSSRGVSGYNPQILSSRLGKKAYNLSYDAGTFELQASKYALYATNNKTPDVIIQNIDLTHFNPGDSLIGENNMLPFREEALFKNHFSGYENHIFEPWNIYSIKYTKNFRFIRKGVFGYFDYQNEHEVNYDGFVPENKAFKEDTRNLQALERTVQVKRYKYLFRNVETVKQTMIQYSKKSKVAIVWAPEYSVRYNMAPELHALVSAEFKKLAGEHPNILFVDLANHPMGKDQSNFYDTFHLNGKGATTFSELLIPYLPL